MNSIKSSLTNQESVLDSINTALQKVSELAIQSGGGVISDADRKAVAQHLSVFLADAYGVADGLRAGGSAGGTAAPNCLLRRPQVRLTHIQLTQYLPHHLIPHQVLAMQVIQFQPLRPQGTQA